MVWGSGSTWHSGQISHKFSNSLHSPRRKIRLDGFPERKSAILDGAPVRVHVILQREPIPA